MHFSASWTKTALISQIYFELTFIEDLTSPDVPINSKL